MEGLDLATGVSTREPYVWDRGSRRGLRRSPHGGGEAPRGRRLDYGMKRNILRLLVDRGLPRDVVPASFSAAEALAQQARRRLPLQRPGRSRGGDVRRSRRSQALLGKVPIFGICLGHQILGLALRRQDLQAEVRPPRRQPAGQGSRPPGRWRSPPRTTASRSTRAPRRRRPIVTHLNLNDQTVEGLSRHGSCRVFSVQYHPESSPGPHDARYLFARFATMMAESSGRP